ncbi:MAG: ThuA domain-containing protein, partial [Candidatus Hydrogenedentes bacterium]|nr:ThuA domain-containing protein [Candidatus Hydrogenedentota bacterium]
MPISNRQRNALCLSALILVSATLTGCGSAEPAPPLNILFLSKSAGFEHGVVKRTDGNPSFLDGVITELAAIYDADREISVNATKDASQINAENLAKHDLVVFYTTGDLTKSSGDGSPPMGENGVTELIKWIEGGGAFMGFHCASDTFLRGFDEVTDYTKMLGGSFARHGKQFKGALRITSPGHAAIAN